MTQYFNVSFILFPLEFQPLSKTPKLYDSLFNLRAKQINPISFTQEQPKLLWNVNNSKCWRNVKEISLHKFST